MWERERWEEEEAEIEEPIDMCWTTEPKGGIHRDTTRGEGVGLRERV